VISTDDAKMTRIKLFDAQILRPLRGGNMDALLKALFNDAHLISAGNCGHSTNYFRA